MSVTRHRVAVVGGGAMGSAAAWHLAARGHRVTVHEQFERGHDHGSSHGNARIFRLAYPDQGWIRLATQSLDLWRGLQEESGRTLIDHVGGVDHGERTHVDAIADALFAAGLPHERLDPAAAAERWPGMRFDRAVVFQADAGTTDAAAAVEALLAAAEGHGAEVHPCSVVEHLEVLGDRAIVHPRDGRPSRVDRVVVTAGAWTSKVLAGVVRLPPLAVTMEQPALFTPSAVAEWPTFIHYGSGLAKANHLDDPIRGYGLPTPDGQVKVGEHHTGRPIDPDAAPDSHDPVRLARVEDYVATWLPGLDPTPARVETCLYTTTPTTDFVVDRVGPIVVGAGFSGHGFKFVPRIGELLADLVEDRPGPAMFGLPA